MKWVKKENITRLISFDSILLKNLKAQIKERLWLKYTWVTQNVQAVKNVESNGLLKHRTRLKARVLTRKTSSALSNNLDQASLPTFPFFTLPWTLRGTVDFTGSQTC